MNSLNFLDLFAGAGGLSEGFIRAGFVPVAHVESNPAACFTLRTRTAWHWLKSNDQQQVYIDYLNGKINRPQLYEVIPKELSNSVINIEIGEATISEIFKQIDELLGDKKLDLIVGGPPCQGYSLIGRSTTRKHRVVVDPRNLLYTYYAEFLKRYKPTYFVFENVVGLLSAKNADGALYLDAMKKLFAEAGYETQHKTLLAHKYGVLQSRKRVFLVGKKGGVTQFPEPNLWNPSVMASELFIDLPTIQANEGTVGPVDRKPYNGDWLYKAKIRNDDIPLTWHQSRPHTQQDLEIYRIAVKLWNETKTRLRYDDLPSHLKTHKNLVSFVDRFKVVASDQPYAHTVIAHIAKDGHYFIHPDISQNRSLTPREAARIQTFPDDYYFESVSLTPQRTPAFLQIGNAVPVLLAEGIAKKLREIW